MHKSPSLISDNTQNFGRGNSGDPNQSENHCDAEICFDYLLVVTSSLLLEVTAANLSASTAGFMRHPFLLCSLQGYL